ATRRGHTSNVVRQAVVQVLPGTVTVLLLLPILIAYLQVAWSIPLLDCSQRGIPGYVPDMIDSTRLVLDSLARGTLIGLKSALGWHVATCQPLATSRLASLLVYALNLEPIIFLSLLAYRFHRLRGSAYSITNLLTKTSARLATSARTGASLFQGRVPLCEGEGTERAE